MKRKRTALLHSVLALLLCIAMLTGTTFAWFTDEVESGRNVITAGNLDVQMYWAEDPTVTVWHNAEDTSLVPFDYAQWEPGYTQVRYVKLVNAGSLALKYSLTLSAVSSVGKLAEVIGVYYAKDVTAKIPDRTLTGMSYLGLLKDAVNGGEAAYGDLQPGDETIVAIAMQMDTQAGNDYQGQDAGSFLFRLVASQMTDESDSFGSDYDADAGLMGSVIHYNISQNISTLTNQGTLTEAVTVGTAENEIFAEVPDGVKLENSADALSLSVNTVTASQADVKLENGENATSLDIHMAGVAEDNTIPMLITLKGLMKKGLNATSVAMYHVENGATVPMVLVANPQNHNEFSYDPATGDVTVAMASFSEVVAVVDNKNLWKGSFDTSWYNTADKEFILTTADQLAGFGKIVDGTAEGIAADTFKDKTVKLGANIDLSGGYSLNPIGWGYANEAHNRDAIAGKTFNGTFDGNGKTIYGLYQNGWDLEASTGTDYTYTNCGFGLFAAASNAVFKNLTISGADIRVECVEAGILVGLSQNGCTYENISIYSSKIANYQRPAGGLIGEVSGEGMTSIYKVTIGSDVVVGSLWGDFDAPVGGVIGARWDDASANPQINMEYVTVACRLDVYNDVTSTYQWYAYRRAGMLIGNTEQVADGNAHLAAARFLTCDNVKVYYAPWVNYHYCEFNNHEPRWPWVRVEAGENCSAYSNPRYGHPKDINGTEVLNDDHVHLDDDTCQQNIPFNQLYGGGQGVYGAETHPGVTIESYDYSVTYMDRGGIFAVDYVKNDTVYTVKHSEYVPTRTESPFKAWVNAGGTKVDSIKAGNDTNYVLYDSWHNVYTARFLDQQGNVIYEEEFNTSQSKLTIEPNVPAVEGLEIVGWEEYNLKTAKGDIAIRPIYKINAYVQLTPIDTDEDGVTNYYQVTGSTITSENVDIVIPEEVNNIKITEITTGAFANGDLRDVFVPNSVNTIGKNAFCKNKDGFFGLGGEFPQIQIIYEGTRTDWDNIDKTAGEWDDNIGSNSIVVCRQNGVISGYYQKNSSTTSRWTWHDGAPDGFPRPEWDENGFPEIK